MKTQLFAFCFPQWERALMFQDIFYSNEGHTWLMHLCISTGPWWVHSALFQALSFCRQIVGSPSPSKQAADSQNFWRLSNMDAQCTCIDGPFRLRFRGWRRSSEREKKLTNRVAASSFFQNFRPLDLRSPTDLSHYPDRSLIEGTWWTAPFPRPARFNREVLHSVRRKFLDGMLRSGCEFRKLIPKRSLKRSIENGIWAKFRRSISENSQPGTVVLVDRLRQHKKKLVWLVWLVYVLVPSLFCNIGVQHRQ